METQLIVLKWAMIVACIVGVVGMQQHMAQAFPCKGGTGKNYCTGYHAGALQADDDYNNKGFIDVDKHLPCTIHTTDYCAGFMKGYNDEGDFYAQ